MAVVSVTIPKLLNHTDIVHGTLYKDDEGDIYLATIDDNDIISLVLLEDGLVWHGVDEIDKLLRNYTLVVFTGTATISN